MNFCTTCGKQVPEGAAFCGNCGTRVAPADMAAPTEESAPLASPPAPPVPPAPATDPGVHPATANPDPMAVLLKMFTGNWIGAAFVALATMGTAFALSVLYAGIEIDDHSAIGGMIANGSNLTMAAFGVPLDLNSNPDHGSMVEAPLLITLLSVAVGIAVFRRVIQGYPDKSAALWDALRTAVVFGVFFTIAAIVIHIVRSGVAPMSSGDMPVPGAPLNGIDGVHVVPAMAGAIFIPALGAAVLLPVAVLRGMLPSANRVIATAAAISTPAVQGLRILIWSTLPAGLVLAIATQTSDGATQNVATYARTIFGLPNLGVATLGTGVGAPYGIRGNNLTEEVGRLGTLSDQLNWVVWFSIPVALLVVIGVAMIVARHAERGTVPWSALSYLASLLIVLPLMGLLANVTLHASGSSTETTKYRVGVDLTELTFTLWGASILACLGALILFSKLGVAHLQARPNT